MSKNGETLRWAIGILVIVFSCALGVVYAKAVSVDRMVAQEKRSDGHEKRIETMEAFMRDGMEEILRRLPE